MKKTNQELKNEALAALNGNWGPAILAIFVYFIVVMILVGGAEAPSSSYIISGASAPNSIEFAVLGITSLLAIFFLYPLAIGFMNAFRVFLDGDTDATGNTFKLGFKNYFHNVWGYFLMALKLILWLCLLLIPGIIMSFAYALTPYILVDKPEISAWEASALSRKMMKGNKGRYFLLYLSFIGWFLLCLLTLGIGLLWLEPYVCTTMGAFYKDVKAQYELQ
ncbi:MAG: DUF975 family protein [Bacteroidales bacterium]|nr:DUF975 family protein [Bacteroidales bacterium]